jgi:hypothetical protein
VCVSIGSERIVCGRESLFTNVTKCHALIRTSFGVTLAGPIAIVAAGDGAEGAELQAVTASATTIATNGSGIRGTQLLDHQTVAVSRLGRFRPCWVACSNAYASCSTLPVVTMASDDLEADR